MKLRILFLLVASLLALSVSAIAEIGPPLAFDTQLNPVTGEHVDYFRIWAVAVDLSDLGGIPEGEFVAPIELRSASVPTETEVDPRNDWLIVLAFVMGLPAESLSRLFHQNNAEA